MQSLYPRGVMIVSRLFLCCAAIDIETTGEFLPKIMPYVGKGANRDGASSAYRFDDNEESPDEDLDIPPQRLIAKVSQHSCNLRYCFGLIQVSILLRSLT